MTDKITDGKGATKERRRHSQIGTRIAEITKGGMPVSLSHYDETHCTLDHLLKGGFIDKNQYDAGMQLRGIYYRFNQSAKSSCSLDTEPGHDGDEMTDADYARDEFRDATRAIRLKYRMVIDVCTIMEDPIPAMYGLHGKIQCGLNDLYDYFTCRKKNNCV